VAVEDLDDLTTLAVEKSAPPRPDLVLKIDRLLRSALDALVSTSKPAGVAESIVCTFVGAEASFVDVAANGGAGPAAAH
jgi:hypothetical protein